MLNDRYDSYLYTAINKNNNPEIVSLILNNII